MCSQETWQRVEGIGTINKEVGLLTGGISGSTIQRQKDTGAEPNISQAFALHFEETAVAFFRFSHQNTSMQPTAMTVTLMLNAISI